MEIVKNSSIFIVNSIEDSLNKFLAVYPTHQTRVIKNEEKDKYEEKAKKQATINKFTTTIHDESNLGKDLACPVSKLSPSIFNFN